MQQVQAGETARLEVLFERHSLPLFRYFVHLTGNASASEDLVQDVFFRVLKYSNSYGPDRNFAAWLYQIARNVYFDQMRKRRGEVALDGDPGDEPMQIPSREPAPEELFHRRQEMDLLRQALAGLPVEKREVLVLSRFQDLRYDEIARILHCEVGAVKVRVYRAMRELGDRYFALRGEKAS